MPTMPEIVDGSEAYIVVEREQLARRVVDAECCVEGKIRVGRARARG